MKNGTTPLEDSLTVSIKLNIILPYTPAVVHLRIHPTDWKHMPVQKPAHNVYQSLYDHSNANNRGNWV